MRLIKFKNQISFFVVTILVFGFSTVYAAGKSPYALKKNRAVPVVKAQMIAKSFRGFTTKRSILQNHSKSAPFSNSDNDKSIKRTINVPDDFRSIQDAIDSSLDGDVILVGPGVYNENLKITGKMLTLKSSDRENTIIDGSNPQGLPAVTIKGGNVVIDGFTIRNNGWGVDVFNSEMAVISNSIIENNKVVGVGCENSIVELSNNIITKTAAFRGAFGRGVQLIASSIVLDGNQITGNVENGVMIFESQGSIINNTISDNGFRGVSVFDGSDIEIEGNTCSGNRETGVLVLDSLCSVSNNSLISNGFRGLDIENSINADVTANFIEDNTEIGFFISGSISIIKDNEINSNASNGMNVQDCPEIEINNNLFEDNLDSGILMIDSVASVSQNSIRNNLSRGVGIQDGSNLIISDNLVEGNAKEDEFNSGIAIFGVNTALINKNVFTDNVVALTLQESSLITVENNMINDNFERGIFVVSVDGLEIVGNEIEGTIFLNGSGDGVEIQESSVQIENNEINGNDLDGARVFSTSRVEFKDNSFANNGDNAVFCDASVLITGCCNLVSGNEDGGFSGCPETLAECPCPEGVSGSDTVVIEPVSILLTRIGSTAQLSAVLTSENGASLNITSDAEWSSSDESVITVDSAGLVTAVSDGVSDLCAEINAIESCAAGLVDTANAGLNQWTVSPQSETLGLVQDVAIDPSNSNILYAATNSGKIFKSTDRGENWAVISEGLRGDSINAILIDPLNPGVLFVGASESFYKSTNNGELWVDLLNGFFITSLVIDPQDSATLYAGTKGDGVLKSVDSGQSWKMVNRGLRFNSILSDSLIIDPVNTDILYAAVETDDGRGAGIFKTVNGGSVWRDASDGLFKGVHGIDIDPVNHDVLYAGTIFNGIFKSVDGANSWFKLANSPHEQSHTITVNGTDSNVIYNGTFGDGVFMSRDAGGSWERINRQLTSRVIRALEIDSVNPSIIYAGTTNGVFRFIHTFDDISAIANSDGTSIDLQYIFNSNADIGPLGFNLYRSGSPDGDFKKITDSMLAPDSLSFNDSEFLEGSTHVYRMSAVTDEGESQKSFSVSTKPLFASNPDFSFAAADERKEVTRGGSTLFPLTLLAEDNFEKEIVFDVLDVPEGVDAQFLPNGGVPPLAAQLIVSAGTSSATGEFELEVTASDGDTVRSEKLFLTVVDSGSITSVITLAINAANVSVGNSVEINGAIVPVREGVEVSVSLLSPNGDVSFEKSVTDINGVFSVITELNKSGTWEIESSFESEEGVNEASSGSVKLFVTQAVTTVSITTDVSVETRQGDTLLLTGRIVPSPGTETVVLEIDNIDGSLNFNSFVPLSNEGEFTHEFKVGGGESGEMRLRAGFNGNDDYSGSEREITIPIQKPVGMAIIAAGGGDASNNQIFGPVNSLANYVYSVIKNQGVSDTISIDKQTNRIFYLHPDPDNDADLDGVADTDGVANAANLQTAIEDWAFDLFDFNNIDSLSDTPLTIYLVGPGDVDSFQLNASEALTPFQLDQWLDNLYVKVQNEFQGEEFETLPVNIIIESAQSGSFLDELKVEDDGIGRGRSIITSTDFCSSDSDEACNTGESNLSADGSVSFSSQFFFGVKVGKSITTAWTEANILIRELFDNQKPQLDSNGDGVTNEPVDEVGGSLVFINRNRVAGINEDEDSVGLFSDESTNKLNAKSFVIDQRPVITGSQKDIIIDKRNATLWAIAEDTDNNLTDVSALLFPPKSSVPELLPLEFSAVNKRFETEFSNFNMLGLYNVLFVARDEFNNSSVAAKTVVNSQNIIPSILKGSVRNKETNGVVADVLVRLQGFSGSVKTDTDGNYLLQMPAGVYSVFAEKEGFFESFLKNVRVESSSVIQNIELSPLSIVTSDGSISGVVTDQKNSAVNRAKVTIVGETINRSDKSDAEGVYGFTGLAQGAYTITVNKRGFNTFEQVVNLAEGEEFVLDVKLMLK